MFIEKFIVDPRHIEIQVLGDKHGNVIYLGERECSIQRRNQKVIEEAPSPLLDEATRARWCEQAVALAKAVNYDSAGTVEFVAGQGQELLFPRNEYPAPGRASGDRDDHRIDLVEQMIRVAAGEKLTLAQKDVTLTGWAVESRVYAEDPFRNFLPSIGRLVKYRPPAESKVGDITVRNGHRCAGRRRDFDLLRSDDRQARDPCASRAAAIEAQSNALDAFYVDGIRHNIPFLSALMNHPRWRAGNLSTGFIAEEFPKGFGPRTPEGETANRIAAVAAAIDHVLGERKRQISGQMSGRAVFRERHRFVWLDRNEVQLDVARDGEGIVVRLIGADGSPGQPVILCPTGNRAIRSGKAALPGIPLPCRCVRSRTASAGVSGL